MPNPRIVTRIDRAQGRLRFFTPVESRDTLVTIGPATNGPAFVPQHLETIDEPIDFSEGTFNTLESVFGLKENNAQSQSYQSALSWLDNQNQVCKIRTLGFGNDGKRVKSGDDAGIVSGAGFVVGDLLKSGSITPGQYSKNKYAHYQDGADGVSGRTYFLGSFYKVKDSLIGVNKTTINRRIINVFNNPENVSNKFFKYVYPEDNTQHEFVSIINAVIMTAHGIVPTLNIKKNISNYLVSTDGGAAPRDIEDEVGQINTIKLFLNNDSVTEQINFNDHEGAISDNFLFSKGVFDSSANNIQNYYQNSDLGFYLGSYFKDGAADKRTYELILNGYKKDEASANFSVNENEIEHKKFIKFSLDPTDDENYLFGSNIKINRDPTKLQEYGYCFYSMFDVRNNYGKFLQPFTSDEADINVAPISSFIVSGSYGRNVSSSDNPNWENFQDKFKRAESPWIISQTYNINDNDKSDLSSAKSLFKVKSLYEGEEGNKIQSDSYTHQTLPTKRTKCRYRRSPNQ